MRRGHFDDAKIESISFYQYDMKANLTSILENKICNQSVHANGFLKSLNDLSCDGLLYVMNLIFNSTEDSIRFIDRHGKNFQLDLRKPIKFRLYYKCYFVYGFCR